MYIIFPGSVLYRWDVEERKVTSECDISTLVPDGDENASCVTQGKVSGAWCCKTSVYIEQSVSRFVGYSLFLILMSSFSWKVSGDGVC